MGIRRIPVTFEGRNGTATVNHNIGEQFVFVQLYRKSGANWHTETGYLTMIVDENSVKIVVSNQRYNVVGAEPPSAYEWMAVVIS